MTDNLTIINHPLVQHKLSLMRDVETPTVVFRQLLREISALLAYEVTADLPVLPRSIDTPVAPMQAPFLAGKKPALISILRAGNGMLEGMLDLMPAARVGFIGLYRDPETLRPVEYYCKLPEQMEDRLAIVVDPMLATGHSAAAAIARIRQSGAREIRFVSLLAAPEGVAQLRESCPEVRLWTAALDERLTDKGYITPGLGDAGDRMFGTK